MTVSTLALVVLGCCLACAAPGSASAQAVEPCSYDTCALRVQRRFFGAHIVQGREERPVASLVWFAPDVPLFAARSDTAARYYASFRRRYTSGKVLSLAGVAALAAGLLVYDSDNDAAAGLVLGGGLLGLGGSIQLARAQDPLSRAIWWYNRTLISAP